MCKKSLQYLYVLSIALFENLMTETSGNSKINCKISTTGKHWEDGKVSMNHEND